MATPSLFEIKTGVNTGANEVQSIMLSAADVDEIQTIRLIAPQLPEVQVITVSKGTGGYFFLELDTSASGGSLQYSGYIHPGDPVTSASTVWQSVQNILSSMNNVRPFGSVSVAVETVDSNTYSYVITFPLHMGNVPQLVAHFDHLTPTGSSSVSVATRQDGKRALCR